MGSRRSGPRAQGIRSQDTVTHWLPGLASLCGTLSQGPSPRRAERNAAAVWLQHDYSEFLIFEKDDREKYFEDKAP
ncbi:Denn Domain-Containing Protein 5A [Manis pentadactyla]|nr:Denn Domain-Containing Protein 5A [Manis pentadactyla]